MEQPQVKLQKYTQNTIKTNSNNEIYLSVYNDSFTHKGRIKELSRIEKAFPSLPEGFYDLLIERLKDHKFTDQRFTDAVNNVIDNCKFPHPTISDFVSWDRKIKLYDYQEVLQMNDRDYKGVAFKYFKRIKSSCKKQMYAHVDDIRDHGLEEVAK